MKKYTLSYNLFLAASFSELAFSFTTPALQQHRSHSSSAPYLQVKVNGGDDVSTAEKANIQSEGKWWEAHELQYADLAEKTRPDFDILSITLPETGKPLVYLDSGATSQKPKQVLKALDYYYQHQNSNVHRGAHTLSREATSAYESARDKVAKLINAYSRNEVVFTSGATEAINLVTQSYARTNLKEGDEVLLTEMEHHANLVSWQILAEQTGIKLKYVPMDRETGAVDQQKFAEMLNKNTKVVGFQHVSNVAGCINPVADMVKVVREKAPEAKVLIDACQSVPHMPVDVQELGVDFLAASGHKMCGPTGVGFLWGREDILNSMPPFMGGGEMIDQVTLEGSTFVPAPGRFEAGTPAIAQAIGMGAAIDYLQEIGGMEKIANYEHEIADYMYRRMSEVDGVTIIGPPKGVTRAAICAFVVDGVHPSDLSSFLDLEGIAVRAGRSRYQIGGWPIYDEYVSPILHQLPTSLPIYATSLNIFCFIYHLGHHCCQPLHHSLGYSHSARASLYFYNTKQ